MHFYDLTFYEYRLSNPIKNLLNVGWIDKSIDFPTGVSPSGFPEKLLEVIFGNTSFDCHINTVRCIHPCDICRKREIEIYCGGKCSVLGVSELMVPDKDSGLFFASPSLIYHYVDCHNYLPPQKYIEAIFAVDTGGVYSAHKIFKEVLSKCK